MIFEVMATRTFNRSPQVSVQLPVFRISTESESEARIAVSSILPPTPEFNYNWCIEEV